MKTLFSLKLTLLVYRTSESISADSFSLTFGLKIKIDNLNSKIMFIDTKIRLKTNRGSNFFFQINFNIISFQYYLKKL